MTGGFCVLDAAVPAERSAWVRLWESSPSRLPFAHPAFSEPMLDPGERLIAAVWDSEGRQADCEGGTAGCVLHVVIVRPVPGGGTDLISPYGYAGPLVWGAGQRPSALASPFWSAYDEWAAGIGAVSEFVRLSLIDDVLPYPGRTSPRLINYVAVLPDSSAALWSSYEPKVRQNVRRAARDGVTVEFDTTGERLDEFLPIYRSTMLRNGSDAWYLFGSHCFEHLHRELPGGFVYVYAMQDGYAVSVDLVLLGTTSAYYYLGGTDADFFHLRPNELVKTAALEYARSTGLTHYVLGGGLRAGDGLERYKRGFAPTGARMFHSGERILDPSGYRTLVRDLNDRAVGGPHGPTAWVEGPGFFPAYRRRFVTSPSASRTEETVR